MSDNKDYTYIVSEDGRKKLSSESSIDRTIEYLTRGNIYPVELNQPSMNSLLSIFLNKIKLHEPTVIVCENDIYKSVFTTLLLLVEKEEIRLKGDMRSFLYFKVVDLADVTQNQLSGEYHDSSLEFENIPVLFVKMNFKEFPNYLNSYCIRNLAQDRKDKGMYTFFYFKGTVGEFLSDKWKIDDTGAGKSGIVYTEKGDVIDNRTLIPITRYVSYFDLNKEMRGGKR